MTPEEIFKSYMKALHGFAIGQRLNDLRGPCIEMMKLAQAEERKRCVRIAIGHTIKNTNGVFSYEPEWKVAKKIAEEIERGERSEK